MLTEIQQETAKVFKCEKCDYVTSRKSSMNKHLLTSKHLAITTFNEIQQKSSKNSKSPNQTVYTCLTCKKEYQSRVGLWYHSKKCVNNAITTNQNISNDLAMEIIQQNKKLTELLMELIKDKHSVVANNSENNNANNDNNDNDGVK